MYNQGNQKELLLMLNAGFFSKKWEKINKTDADNRFSQKEQLIDACWNGMTREILPECFDKNYDKSITLSEINDGNAFIDLEFCEGMQRKEKEFSVNPYIFMEVQGFN